MKWIDATFCEGSLRSQVRWRILARLSRMDPATETSAPLVERIRRGDPSAEEELIASFSSRVFAMAVVRTRDREASRDLVQDILWAVVQSLRKGQLRQSDKLAAFVCGIARNLINNYCRMRTRAPHDVSLTPDLCGADPGQTNEDEERVQLLREAIANLEVDDRRILILTLVEGLKPGEIAFRLRLTPEVVRQRKSRAIKKVIGILGERSRT